MSEHKNVYTLSQIVVDAEGRKHKVYPTPILYIQEVAQFLAQLNPDFIFASFMIAELDETGVIERNDDGKIVYGRTFTEELLSVIEIALRFKETKEQIREWLDIGLAQEIVEVLIGLSQVKKKKQNQSPTGTV